MAGMLSLPQRRRYGHMHITHRINCHIKISASLHVGSAQWGHYRAYISQRAVTPEEIALSILAEIVQLRRRGTLGDVSAVRLLQCYPQVSLTVPFLFFQPRLHWFAMTGQVQLWGFHK